MGTGLKQVDWLLVFWLAAGIWTTWFCYQMVFSSALYLAGPLVALAIWLIPLLPLVAITWIRRLWRLGSWWRWLPGVPLALLFAVAAIPFRVPRVEFGPGYHRTVIFWNTYVGAIGTVLIPVLLLLVFWSGLWAGRRAPRAKG